MELLALGHDDRGLLGWPRRGGLDPVQDERVGGLLDEVDDVVEAADQRDDVLAVERRDERRLDPTTDVVGDLVAVVLASGSLRPALGLVVGAEHRLEEARGGDHVRCVGDEQVEEALLAGNQPQPHRQHRWRHVAHATSARSPCPVCDAQPVDGAVIASSSSGDCARDRDRRAWARGTLSLDGRCAIRGGSAGDRARWCGRRRPTARPRRRDLEFRPRSSSATSPTWPTVVGRRRSSALDDDAGSTSRTWRRTRCSTGRRVHARPDGHRGVHRPPDRGIARRPTRRARLGRDPARGGRPDLRRSRPAIRGAGSGSSSRTSPSCAGCSGSGRSSSTTCRTSCGRRCRRSACSPRRSRATRAAARDPARMRDRIAKIEVETGHLVQMVNELLDLVADRERRQRSAASTTSTWPLAVGVRRAPAALRRAPGRGPPRRRAGRLPPVRGDEDRLGQVLVTCSTTRSSSAPTAAT